MHRVRPLPGAIVLVSLALVAACANGGGSDSSTGGETAAGGDDDGGGSSSSVPNYGSGSGGDAGGSVADAGRGDAHASNGGDAGGAGDDAGASGDDAGGGVAAGDCNPNDSKYDIEFLAAFASGSFKLCTKGCASTECCYQGGIPVCVAQ